MFAVILEPGDVRFLGNGADARRRFLVDMGGRGDGTPFFMVAGMFGNVMNLRQLAQRLGALRPDVRALFMSGYTADTVLRQGIMRDGLAFLQKPFKGRHLLLAVRDVLRKPPVRP